MTRYLTFLIAVLFAVACPAQTTQPTIAATLLYGGNPVVDRVAKHDPAASLQVATDWDAAFVYVDWKQIGIVRAVNGVITIGKPEPGVHLIDMANATVGRKGDTKLTFTLEIASNAYRFGTITDNGTPATNVPLLQEAGFNSIRLWVSFNPTTGALNESKLDAANAYVAAGVNVSIVLTPDGANPTVVNYPAAAIASIKAKLDRRIVVTIFNESNLAFYWPWGDVPSAFKMAAKISRELQAAGFTTGSPSLTTGDDKQIRGWLAAAAFGGDFPFDLTTLHCYPSYDPAKPDAAYKNMADCIEAAKFPEKPVYVDEWGFDPKSGWTKDAAHAQLGRYKTLLESQTWGSAYFIFSKTGKLPHDGFPWLYDPTTKTKTDTFSAFKRLSGTRPVAMFDTWTQDRGQRGLYPRRDFGTFGVMTQVLYGHDKGGNVWTVPGTPDPVMIGNVAKAATGVLLNDIEGSHSVWYATPEKITLNARVAEIAKAANPAIEMALYDVPGIQHGNAPVDEAAIDRVVDGLFRIGHYRYASMPFYLNSPRFVPDQVNKLVAHAWRYTSRGVEVMPTVRLTYVETDAVLSDDDLRALASGAQSAHVAGVIRWQDDVTPYTEAMGRAERLFVEGMK